MINKLIVFLIFALFILLTTDYQLPTTFAQTGSCSQDTQNPVFSGGLITSPGGGSGCSTDTGVYVFDEKIKFLSFRIPTYDELKSIYFDQSKAKNRLTYVAGDLNVSGNTGNPGVRIIFVDGNLTISQNYTYGDGSTGTVFVVKGNINIDPIVTQVDGILISGGTIYTAGAGCTTSDPQQFNQQLVINGSLISLNENKPIQFCRNLQGNNATQPAELINHQVKYLVILKDLFSETFQKWSEIP